MISNYDEAYSNGAFITDGDSYPARWAEAAAAFRAALPAGCRAELDQTYGPGGARQRFDLFHPAGVPKGLCVFVHGGYWMRFSKDDWSHLAVVRWRGLGGGFSQLHAGTEATISTMTGEIAKAISAAASRIAGPSALRGILPEDSW
ncbi:MAG: hypothetical protein U1E15_08040 [Hyphomicrobiales bacterium]